MHLPGKKIFLRSVEPADADTLYKWENDKSLWNVSGTKRPFTKKEIKVFIQDQKDVYLDKQLRLMICSQETTIGCIDLFEFDGKKAGVGILIDKKYRDKGFASDALRVLIKYSFDVLNLQELNCTISEDNKTSIRLFQKHKFKITDQEKSKLHLLLERK